MLSTATASNSVERRNQALWFALTSGTVAASFVLAGLGGPFDKPVLCPLRALTGIPCPLCGSTTSFVSTAAGHFRDAFAASPVGPIAFVAVALVAVALAVALVRRRRLPSVPTVSPRVRHTLLVAAFACLWVWQLARFNFLL